jgi:hypothetical protein
LLPGNPVEVLLFVVLLDVAERCLNGLGVGL